MSAKVGCLFAEASHGGSIMRQHIFLGVCSALALAASFGCASDTNRPPTEAEKKAFIGGPMPASARKEFEEGQKKSEAARAALAAKAKAAAMGKQ